MFTYNNIMYMLQESKINSIIHIVAKDRSWRCWGSIPGPIACKAIALPLSYIPTAVEPLNFCLKLKSPKHRIAAFAPLSVSDSINYLHVKNEQLTTKYWFRPGSNRGPSACEADVMTTTPRNH